MADGNVSGLRDKIYLDSIKSTMKKITIILCFFIVPISSQAEITVNWQPQAGISYSWYDRIDWLENRLSIGYSGGVSAEIRLNNLFGIKTGAAVSQYMIYTVYELMLTDSLGNFTGTTELQTKNQIFMAEVPLSGMLYLEPIGDIQVFLGLGVIPAFKTYVINHYAAVPASPNVIIPSEYITDYYGEYRTGLSAECGIHWNAGPGKVTAGIAYTLYLLENELSGNLHSLKLNAGYLF